MRQFAMTWLEDEHVLVVVNMAIGLRCVEALQDTYTHIHTLIYIYIHIFGCIYIYTWSLIFGLVRLGYGIQFSSSSQPTA